MMGREQRDAGGTDARRIPGRGPSQAGVSAGGSRGTAMPADAGNLLENGFLSHFTRPIRVGRLMEALNEALELNQRDG